MATAMHVPLEVYLRSSEYEPDAEYVDGVIEERPTGELDHADWQAAVVLWFTHHAKEWNIKVYPELRVQVAPTRLRIPDVTVIDRGFPVEQIITRPPIAVFEILSPEDTVRRMTRKLADYAAMGIPQIWLVDPETGGFQQYANGCLGPGTRFNLADRGIDFELSAIAEFLQK